MLLLIFLRAHRGMLRSLGSPIHRVKLRPRQSKPLTYPDKLAASIAEGRITYPDRSHDGGCRQGVQARSRETRVCFLQITRDRLGLELSDAKIKVTIPVILR